MGLDLWQNKTTKGLSRTVEAMMHSMEEMLLLETNER